MKELVSLPENQRNSIVPLQSYLLQNKIQGFTHSLDKQYYPYNTDIHDLGWGCAWRAIQTLISPKQTHFKNLFQTYSKQNKLNEIISKLYPNLETLKQLQQTQTKWCPQYNNSGWAEPFIGRLVLNSFGINSQLIAVNDIPFNANAPKSVFDKILTFSQFKSKLIEHFQNKRGPIFIDDATYSLCIWGYKQDKFFQILLADPHIKSNKQQKFTGIYTVSLDQNGNQISNSVTEASKKYYGQFQSYQVVRFNYKSWMVLFPSD